MVIDVWPYLSRKKIIKIIGMVSTLALLSTCGGGSGEESTGGNGPAFCIISTVCFTSHCQTYNFCEIFGSGYNSLEENSDDENRFACKYECPEIFSGVRESSCLEQCDNLYPDTTAPTTIATPAGGTYDSTLRILFSLQDNDTFCEGRTYYTTDGSIPNTDSPYAPFFDANGLRQPIIFQNTTLRYFSTDCVGNQEGDVNEDIYVINDVTVPIVTLLGSSQITLFVGETYIEWGATVTDDDPTVNVTITGTVDTSTPGTYSISYNATDRVGNAASTITRAVNVIPDTIAPVITLTGAVEITLGVHSTYAEQGATATDNFDATVSVSITGTVDTSTLGIYFVTYNANDSTGNAAVEVTRTINVIEDIIAPVITLGGSALITLLVGDTYVEQGATATDNIDTTVNVSITGTVDTSTPGIYSVTYNANDSTGNAAIEIVRSIEIIADAITIMTPPVNDTGLLHGANYPSGYNVTCMGETIAEQDCSKGRDALNTTGSLTKTGAGHGGFDFTKLDTNGTALAASANSWSCVRDNHTGLVWEVKDTILGSIHNQDNVYKWGGKTSLLNGDNSNRFNDWDALVDGSNAGAGLCGFTDWRVPSVNQLQSIVNYNQSNPAIDTNYFPNSKSELYWSASPLMGNNFSSAWHVQFRNGVISRFSSTISPHSVRLVRGGQ